MKINWFLESQNQCETALKKNKIQTENQKKSKEKAKVFPSSCDSSHFLIHIPACLQHGFFEPWLRLPQQPFPKLLQLFQTSTLSKGSTFSKVARCHHCTPLAWPQWILLRLNELGSYTSVPLCLTIWQKKPPLILNGSACWPGQQNPLLWSTNETLGLKTCCSTLSAESCGALPLYESSFCPFSKTICSASHSFAGKH